MQLNCPCGEIVEGEDEDELVEKVQAHLREAHPDRTYTREQILFFAS
jgi:predicted small metal-binding protein